MQSTALRLIGKHVLARRVSPKICHRNIATMSTASSASDHQKSIVSYSSVSFAAALMAASTICVSTVACEEEPNVEHDPYDNLPDEDEPTHCSICNINRQGPCRPFWRKFERCMKDQMAENKKSSKQDDNDDSGEVDNDSGSGADDVSPLDGAGALGEKCDKYMMPWISCFQSNRDCYNLTTNKFYQKEYIDPTEKAVQESDKRCWIGIPDVVWRNLVEYSTRKNNPEDLAADTVLCDCQARVPLVDPEKDYPVEVAYVRDENGTILGFDMFTSDKNDGKAESFLNFSVQIGKTKGITVYAIYQSPPPPPPTQRQIDTTKSNDDESDDKQPELQRVLYTSRPVFVPAIEGVGLDKIKWQELTSQCRNAFE